MTTATTREYVSCVEVARIIRAELKEAFPGIKFSVRSKKYAGGASVRISWTDGPTEAQVNEIGKRFEGCTFDGRIDLQSYQLSEHNGQTFQSGAHYVFADRGNSREALQQAIDAVFKEYGLEGRGITRPEIQGTDAYPYVSNEKPQRVHGRWLSQLIHEHLNQTDLMAKQS